MPVEKDETLCSVVAEVSRKVVANVGVLGIAIKNGFRDLGIGTEMMKILTEEQTRKMSLKVLTLTAFATNKCAIHVYKKLGLRLLGEFRRGFSKMADI